MQRRKSVNPKEVALALASINEQLTDKDWQKRIKYLARDTSRSRSPDMGSRRTHGAIQKDLPFYLAGIQAGHNAEDEYAKITSHLKQCAECRAHFELLYEIVIAMREASPRTQPLKNPNQLWRKIEFPKSPTLGEKIRFVLYPHLWRLHQTQPMLTRSGEESELVLLLHDEWTTEMGSVFVQAWLVTIDVTGKVNLVVKLATTSSIKRRMHTILKWGNQRFEEKISRGTATFRGIFVGAIDSTTDITLELTAK